MRSCPTKPRRTCVRISRVHSTELRYRFPALERMRRVSLTGRGAESAAARRAAVKARSLRSRLPRFRFTSIGLGMQRSDECVGVGHEMSTLLLFLSVARPGIPVWRLARPRSLVHQHRPTEMRAAIVAASPPSAVGDSAGSPCRAAQRLTAPPRQPQASRA